MRTSRFNGTVGVMLAVLATVLALAGAPTNTVVVCNPALGSNLAETHYLRTPPTMELGPIACSALMLVAASPVERAKIAALNPGVNLDQRIGVGLLVVLHESFHAALRSGDETLVECRAMANIETLLARLGPNPAAELVFARASDAALPAAYHLGC